jgi:hypothetical protein
VRAPARAGITYHGGWARVMYTRDSFSTQKNLRGRDLIFVELDQRATIAFCSAFEIADVAHRDRPALATYPVHDVHRGGERVTRAKRVVSAILGAREDECARVAIEQASDSENVNAVS